MAFLSRFGNLLRQTTSNQMNSDIASKPSIYQAVRCMSTKLFIGGISYSTDDNSLSEAFSKYGEVQEARVIIDRETGRSRGFGFVTFLTPDAASSAMQALDGQELHGRRVKVNFAADRRASYGGGGGGGYNSGYGGGAGGGYNSGYGGGGGGGGGYNSGYGGGGGYNNGYGGGAGGGYNSGYGAPTGPGYGGGDAADGGDGYGSGRGAYGGGNTSFGSANTFNNHGGDYGVAGDSTNAGGFEGNNRFSFGADKFGSSDKSDAAGGFGQGEPLDLNLREEDDDGDFAKRA